MLNVQKYSLWLKVLVVLFSFTSLLAMGMHHHEEFDPAGHDCFACRLIQSLVMGFVIAFAWFLIIPKPAESYFEKNIPSFFSQCRLTARFNKAPPLSSSF